jgi:hypothetical protein
MADCIESVQQFYLGTRLVLWMYSVNTHNGVDYVAYTMHSGSVSFIPLYVVFRVHVVYHLCNSVGDLGQLPYGAVQHSCLLQATLVWNISNGVLRCCCFLC